MYLILDSEGLYSINSKGFILGNKIFLYISSLSSGLVFCWITSMHISLLFKSEFFWRNNKSDIVLDGFIFLLKKEYSFFNLYPLLE
jgi:hypothetical protein